MLRYLFNKVGFGWAVRISALMAAVLCVVAILTVRQRRPIEKTGLVLDVRTIKDRRFLLLASGSFFVCLGVPAFLTVFPKSSPDPMNPLRHIHSLLLYSRLHPVSERLVQRCILCALHHERGRDLWSRCTSLVIGQDRAIQSPVPLGFSLWIHMPRLLDVCQEFRFDRHLCRCLRVLVGSAHLCHQPMRGANIRHAGDRDAHWRTVHADIGAVRRVTSP